jgi:hypothetical protein
MHVQKQETNSNTQNLTYPSVSEIVQNTSLNLKLWYTEYSCKHSKKLRNSYYEITRSLEEEYEKKR